MKARYFRRRGLIKTEKHKHHNAVPSKNSDLVGHLAGTPIYIQPSKPFSAFDDDASINLSENKELLPLGDGCSVYKDKDMLKEWASIYEARGLTEKANKCRQYLNEYFPEN